MLDRSIPSHLRDPTKPPKYLEGRSRTNWIKHATKMLQNYFYAQDYPPFIVPTSLYTIVHVHECTTEATMQLLIDHVATCHEFSIDTESEMIKDVTIHKKKPKLALIRIQTISPRLPSCVILIDLAHLPPVDALLMIKIRLLFETIFKFGNKLYAWGPLPQELYPATSYRIFNWPIQAHKVNIQDEFNGWYERGLPQCEACDLSLLSTIALDASADTSGICRCRRHYPYSDLSTPWSLQNAMADACKLFLDKSMTMNQWTAGLDMHYPTLSTALKHQMIQYAISDCKAITQFIRAFEEKWSLEHLKMVHVAELFVTTTLSEYESISEDEIDITTNTDVIARSPAYELISEDEEPVRPQILLENDEQNIVNDHILESLPSAILNTNQRRIVEALRRRNQLHNHAHRRQRYQHRIVRPIYTRFTMIRIKKILRRLGVHFVHIKIEDRYLIIGLRNEPLCEVYEQQIPTDLFNRYSYYH